ncbi:MAG: 16S rRNA (uracil(1498)-N(3))-methyltransferase [Deltaproteobacteria bacterium]|nr:16S rRNA (uracil(1498)-N(3))-methyltransferase [Deltaproteobacteria bacterium]
MGGSDHEKSMTGAKRFWIDSLPEVSGTVSLTGTEAHHVRNVLRLSLGDLVELVSSTGRQAMARIYEIDRSGVKLIVENLQPAENEPPLSIVLGLAVLKADRMDWVVQKATELGLSALIPVTADRSVVQLEQERAAKRTERWRQIARQAVKQCRRGRAPEVAAPVNLKSFFDICLKHEVKIVLHEAAEHHASNSWANLQNLFDRPQTVAALVGPEGGFTNHEIMLAREAGFSVLGMGPRILRAETAALALLAVIGFLWGDLANFS